MKYKCWLYESSAWMNCIIKCVENQGRNGEYMYVNCK
jgi:hypothetical protein